MQFGQTHRGPDPADDKELATTQRPPVAIGRLYYTQLHSFFYVQNQHSGGVLTLEGSRKKRDEYAKA